MKKKFQERDNTQESALSSLLGPPQGNLDESPHCSAKMGIEDGYIHCLVRVYSKHRLIYRFERGAIHEKLFSRKEYHRAGRRFEHYFDILTDLMTEQFLKVLQRMFEWGAQAPDLEILPKGNLSASTSHALRMV
jgi:hypothetical protein